MTITALCVGGPLDGEMFSANPHGFRAPTPQSIQSVPLATAVKDEPHVTYVLSTFSTPSRESMSFWVPIGTDPMDTMGRLAAAYQRKVRKT